LDEVQAAGEHSIVWEAWNLTSGVYLAKLQIENNAVVQKLVLQK
jgi:hypothetical protein